MLKVLPSHQTFPPNILQTHSLLFACSIIHTLAHTLIKLLNFYHDVSSLNLHAVNFSTINKVIMKYSVAILAFAAGVFAFPQDSASITSAPVPSASLTPAVSCVLDCAAGDVTCQAACMGNARPNSQQVVDTNECAAACDQGSGSKEDTEAYAKCQQDCFASLFPSSQTNFQGAAGGVSSAASAAASAASSAVASATNAAGSAVSSGKLI